MSLPVIDVNSEAAQQERKDLLDSQLQQLVKVNLKHCQEKSLLDQEAKQEKHCTFLSLEEQSLQQMQQALRRKELEFQKEFAQKQGFISVEESDKLIEAHQKEIHALKEHLEAEKQQQKQVCKLNYILYSCSYKKASYTCYFIGFG